MVDIHADELVRQVAAHVARILQRVLHRFRPMIEAELDAGSEGIRDFFPRRRVESLMNDVPPERQRQPVVLLSPPDAQIFADHEPFIAVGKLPFVDDQADFRRAAADGLENPVKGHDDVIEFLRRFAEPELQREKRAGHGSRHGDFFPENFFTGKLLFRHQHRAIAVAHARAAGQQRVFIGNVSVGMNADGGDVEFSAGGAFVQRLNVLQNVLEMKTMRRNKFLGQAIKHESVIRIR